MENKLIIKQVENGYILKWTEDWGDDKKDIRVYQHLIEDKENNEKKTMTELLIYVSEHFGIFYDKYKKDNLKISFDKKGHKVD